MALVPRRMDDARRRLDPAAGRVPARHFGEGRAHRHARLLLRRGALFLLRLRADVHRLLGAAHRSGIHQALCQRGRARDPAHPAQPDPRAHADVGADSFLRCAAFGHPVHRERGAARADGAFHRERGQAVRATPRRPAVPAAAARGAGRLHAGGAALRAQFQEHHVRDGAERLQGHARLVHRAARRGHLLEARHHRGRHDLGGVRTPLVGHRRAHGARRHAPAAARRARVLAPRHVPRVARSPQIMRASPLARILVSVFAALIAYASLYPMEGWRDPGVSPFAYLNAPWPRHITSFDVTVNFLGYIPYGFLAVAALHPRLRGIPAFLVATASALALTLTLEALQSYLPARFPSNLDALCNLLGAALRAALAARFAPRLLAEGPAGRWRQGAFLPAGGIDLGLALMGLWLFTQLNPTTSLFGAGDLRDFLGARGPRGQRPEFFITIE